MKIFNKKLNGNAIIIVVCVVAVFAVALPAMAISVVPLGFMKAGEPTRETTSFANQGNGGGCSVPDPVFTDLTSYDTSDKIIANITPDYKTKLQQPDRKSKLDVIVSESKNRGVNPAILVSMWVGEASAKAENDDAAFGCGVYGGQNRFPGFERQTSCATEMVKKAVDQVDPYHQRPGEGTWTNLFYTYVGAMKAFYEKNGYVSDSSNPRYVIMKNLYPNEATCTRPVIVSPTELLSNVSTDGFRSANCSGITWLEIPKNSTFYIRQDGTNNGANEHWGTVETVRAIISVTKTWKDSGEQKIEIGEISGRCMKATGHETHATGRGADISVPGQMMDWREGGISNGAGARYPNSSYGSTQKAKMQKLAELFIQAGASSIIYNDRDVASAINNKYGKTIIKSYVNHEAHFHVNFPK